MNRLIWLCFLLIFTFAIRAEKENRVPSLIEDVTVYRQMARISSIATVNIPAGNSTVIFEDLSTGINPASLQVFLKGNMTLLSASYQTNYLNRKVKSERLKQLEDSLELVSYDITSVQDQKQVYTEEENLLKANFSLGNEKTGFTATEVMNLANFYRSRSMELHQKQLELTKKANKLNEAKTRLNQQIADLQASYNQSSGEIVLNVSAEQPVSGQIRCAYLVTGAGWSPQYDLRSEGFGKPVQLIYKANVFQNTGYDWKNVKLSVSTANPSGNNSRPVMNPRYVDFISYVATGYSRKADYGGAYMLNMAAAPMLKEKNEEKDGLMQDQKFEESKPLEGDVNDNVINVQFDLAQRQDIPSDAKAHLVAMDQQSLPATYLYHAVPKIEQAAFLLAKVTDWGKLNLIPGNANIFLDGAYVGQSYIDPTTTGDTLLLSFGRDDKLNVKRIKLNELCETKWISTNKKETFAYETTIRNTKSTAVDMELLDQIPISRSDDIKVEIEQMDGAEYNADYGKLIWKFNLPAGQTKKIRLIYSIKYPKDKQIQETN